MYLAKIAVYIIRSQHTCNKGSGMHHKSWGRRYQIEVSKAQRTMSLLTFVSQDMLLSVTCCTHVVHVILLLLLSDLQPHTKSLDVVATRVITGTSHWTVLLFLHCWLASACGLDCGRATALSTVLSL